MITPSASSEGKKESAVVIGGSMGGLMAARVLADYYAEVLIIDRDSFPQKPEDRAGTPQSFHPHRLTPRVKMILNRLFPGFQEDLLAYGAANSLNKIICQINHYGEYSLPNEEEDSTCSRALMEWAARERVKRIDNVRFLPQHQVTRLQTNLDRTVVTGVQVKDRDSQQVKTISADLVIDISGRQSKLGQWLTELGYEVPAPDRLLVSLSYSTRRYHIPADAAMKWDVIRIAGHPDHGTMTGVLSIIENQVAEVLLYGLGGQFPTVEADEYEKQCRELVSPKIAEVLSRLEPMTPPRGYRVPELTNQRYELMERWPAGLLTLGDAYCNFDPIFGQGITMAGISVEILDSCLREQQKNAQPNFERYVLRRIKENIEPGWWLNCAADLAWPNVKYVGQPLQGVDFAQKYLELCLKQATIKKDYARIGLYWAVNSLLFAPNVLINPHMIASALEQAAPEEQQWLRQYTEGGNTITQEVLDRIVPSFSGADFVEFPF